MAYCHWSFKTEVKDPWLYVECYNSEGENVEFRSPTSGGSAVQGLAGGVEFCQYQEVGTNQGIIMLHFVLSSSNWNGTAK